jgi:hypothetical protein
MGSRRLEGEMEMTDSSHAPIVIIAGPSRRITELERENAALRAKAREFAEAVEREREQLPASVRDETMPGTPRALGRLK